MLYRLKLLFVNPTPACAELIAEDFGLLQLYAESVQSGGGLATYLKSYRAAAKKKAKDAGGSSGTDSGAMSAANASTVVMVTASALAAQVYPDSKFGSLHAKQLTGEAQHSAAQRGRVWIGARDTAWPGVKHTHAQYLAQ
jgi:hypothetical protein